MRTSFRGTLLALVLSAAWGAGLGAIHFYGSDPVIDRLEASLTNLRTEIRGKERPADAVTIVAIDDETARRIGAYPLPRAKLAEIVNRIRQLQPSVIALDMLLIDPGSTEGDLALAEALSRGRSVIAGAAMFSDSLQPAVRGAGLLEGLPIAPRLLLPQRRFMDAAALGLVNFQTDKSGTPRFAPMLFNSGGQVEAAFALRVASVATGMEPVFTPDAVTVNNHRIATDFGQNLPISFFGPRGTIPTFSAIAAQDGSLPETTIRNRVVIVGATITGGGDVFPTPFDPVLPGVEVVATAVTQLMTGHSLVRDRNTRRIDFGFAVVLPVVFVGLLTWRRSGVALVAMATLCAACVAINYVAFVHDIWLSAALPVAAAMPPVIIFGCAQLLMNRNRAAFFARQSALLQRIQAPGMTEFLARDPQFLAQPVRQDAAVVFIDINGFTGLSEHIGPGAVRELLNDFYDIVDEEVTACGGSITSFMGDGAMIVFGLPKPSPQDAANAARCCVRMAQRMDAWLLTLSEAHRSRIGFKIGGHFGAIVASRLGGGSHQQMTATGDTVNVASRLMEVAAKNEAAIAVSDELMAMARQYVEPFNAGSLEGPIDAQIRGRSEVKSVWLWRGSADVAKR